MKISVKFNWNVVKTISIKIMIRQEKMLRKKVSVYRLFVKSICKQEKKKIVYTNKES